MKQLVRTVRDGVANGLLNSIEPWDGNLGLKIPCRYVRSIAFPRSHEMPVLTVFGGVMFDLTIKTTLK